MSEPAPKLTPGLHLLRFGVLAYYAVVLLLALWAAVSVIGAQACGDGACEGRGVAVVGDWLSAMDPVTLAVASAAFTGVVIAGMVLFAIPWFFYGRDVRRRRLP